MDGHKIQENQYFTITGEFLQTDHTGKHSSMGVILDDLGALHFI